MHPVYQHDGLVIVVIVDPLAQVFIGRGEGVKCLEQRHKIIGFMVDSLRHEQHRNVAASKPVVGQDILAEFGKFFRPFFTH